MGICSKFKTDKNLERDGVWVSCEELNGESVVNSNGTFTKFKVARIGVTNRQYMAKMQPIAKKLEGKDGFALLESRQQLIGIFVDYCLLDWENFFDYEVSEKGGKTTYKEVEVPFSKEKAKEYLIDMPELYQWLSEQSSSLNNFLSANKEEDLKN